MIAVSQNAKAGAMDKLSFQNPLFNTYAVAASVMILKAVLMSWLTVVRMMQVKGGFRSPEDIRKTILNPKPSAEQLAPNEYVDRIRRIQLNDLENRDSRVRRLSCRPSRNGGASRSFRYITADSA